MTQGRLGDQLKGIGLLLLHCRRVELLASGRAGVDIELPERRPKLSPRGHPSREIAGHVPSRCRPRLDTRAVSGSRLSAGCLTLLGLTVHTTPTTDDPFDMLSSTGPTDSQQPFFRLGCGDTRELANFGVRELAVGEGLRQPRQSAQGACYAHVLPRRAGREPDAPREPRRARAEAVAPTSACIELANEIQEPGSGAVQMRRQLSDLFAQAIHSAVIVTSGVWSSI